MSIATNHRGLGFALWGVLWVAASMGGSIHVDAGPAHVMVGPNGQVHVHEASHTHVDLHALCESLAERCWDLDPDDLGMTPVNTFVNLADGTLARAESEAGAHWGMRLAGERVAVHVHANNSASVSNSQDDDMPEDQVRCGDDPLCPDLIVEVVSLAASTRIDLRSFEADDCAVVEESTQPGERRLLRFTFTSPNVGLGDLQIGRPDDHPAWFTWGECHGHWHFREYADYRLWNLTAYGAWQAIRASHPGVPPADLLDAFPEVAAGMVSGHKQGFCVIDFMVYLSPPAGPVFPRQYTDCHENQGITPYWADSYNRALDGQWVDITDVPPGVYALEAEVNPERLYIESAYDNNAQAVFVQVP